MALKALFVRMRSNEYQEKGRNRTIIIARGVPYVADNATKNSLPCPGVDLTHIWPL